MTPDNHYWFLRSNELSPKIGRMLSKLRWLYFILIFIEFGVLKGHKKMKNRLLSSVALSILTLSTCLSAGAQEYKHKAPVTGLLPPGNPHITISPSDLSFPDTNIGSSSVINVTVTNPDTFSGLVNLKALLDTSVFTFDSNSCGTIQDPVILGPTDSCNAAIRFTPTDADTYTGTLAVSADNSTNGVQSRLLTAKGLGYETIVDPAPYAVYSATVLRGDSHIFPISFSNTGNASSKQTYVALSGDNYSITSNTCGTQASPSSIPAGGSCSVSVLASSLDFGAFAGYLGIFSNNSGSALISKAMSFGFDSQAAWSDAREGQAAVTGFGTITNNTQVDKVVFLRNTGSHGNMDLGLNFSGDLSDITVTSVQKVGSVYTGSAYSDCGAGSPLIPSVASCVTTDIADGINTTTGNHYPHIAVGLRFNPTTLGTKSISISTSSNNDAIPSSPVVISGTSMFDAVGSWSSSYNSDVAVSSVAMPDTNIGTNSVTTYVYIRNNGTYGSLDSNFNITGDSSEFSIVSIERYGFFYGGVSAVGCGAVSPFTGADSRCVATDIHNGSTVPDGAFTDNRPYIRVGIRFNPTSIGAKSITITPVSNNEAPSVSSLTVSGNGVDTFASVTTVDMKFDTSLTNSGTAGSAFSASNVTYGTTAPISGTYVNTVSNSSISRPYDSNQGFAYFAGDYTIEAWVKPTNSANGAIQGVYSSGAMSGGQPNFVFGISGAGKLLWITGVYGSNTLNQAGNTTITSGQWTHLAISRQGTTTRYFVNGQLQTMTVLTSNGSAPGQNGATFNGSGNVFIGKTAAGEQFTGGIDSVRVTKAARYTTSFTPAVY